VIWDANSGRLWWSDIEDKRLWWFDASEHHAGSIGLPERLCAFAPRRSGGWIMAFASGIELWSSWFERQQRICDFEPKNGATRLNDGRTDRQGRFVVGGMNEATGAADSSVIRIAGDLSVETLISGVACANSICFSADGNRLFFADTPDRRIRVYDYRGSAIASEATYDVSAERGLPDGSCVDAEGGIWNAAWEGGRVIRIDARGNVTHRIEVPVPKATCCAFGGADLATLFVTTSRLGSSAEDVERYPQSGSLFSVRPGVKGVEDVPFAG